jgi:hypothetical protein
MAGETPPPMQVNVCHETFNIGDGPFSGSEGLSRQFQQPQGVALAINPASIWQAERILTALVAGGTVHILLEAVAPAARSARAPSARKIGLSNGAKHLGDRLVARVLAVEVRLRRLCQG